MESDPAGRTARSSRRAGRLVAGGVIEYVKGAARKKGQLASGSEVAIAVEIGSVSGPVPSLGLRAQSSGAV